MKRTAILLLTLCLIGNAWGQGSSIFPYSTPFARTLLDDLLQADAQTTLGLGTGDSPTFSGLTLSDLAQHQRLQMESGGLVLNELGGYIFLEATDGSYPVIFADPNGKLAGDSTYFTYSELTDALTLTNNIIGPNSVTFQPAADSTTFFQVMDADGGVPVFNVDSTNERVGIGTATPLYKLHMEGSDSLVNIVRVNDAALSGPGFLVERARNTVAAPSVVLSGDSLGKFHVRAYDGAAYDDAGVIEFFAEDDWGTSKDTYFSLQLSSAGTLYERLTLSSAGVLSAKSVDVLDSTGGILTLSRDDTIVFNANTIGKIQFWNNDTTLTTQNIYADIEAQSDQTISTDAAAGTLIFRTTGTTVAGSPVERMRISSSGNINIGTSATAETLLELQSTAPYITLHNSTHEDTDGGRESRLNFKGEQSGEEETTLARIEVSHDGAADDEKGKIVISTNATADTDTPTVALTIDSGQSLTIANTIESPKFKMTAIGGFAILLTNKTGAVTVAGQLVKADTATDDAVILTAAGDDECFGVFLDAGIADGSEAWVVISGIADVAFDDNVAAVHGDWVSTGVAAGYAAIANSPAAAPTHFEELGHCIESVAAGGAGTHILARCIPHFN